MPGVFKTLLVVGVGFLLGSSFHEFICRQRFRASLTHQQAKDADRIQDDLFPVPEAHSITDTPDISAYL
jgi:hypothetical protein